MRKSYEKQKQQPAKENKKTLYKIIKDLLDKLNSQTIQVKNLNEQQLAKRMETTFPNTCTLNVIQWKFSDKSE